jgi:hypothetical protein
MQCSASLVELAPFLVSLEEAVDSEQPVRLVNRKHSKYFHCSYPAVVVASVVLLREAVGLFVPALRL